MRAWLFDLYAHGPEMILWFIADDGRRIRLRDPFALPFYAGDWDRRSPREREAFLKTLAGLPGFSAAGPAERLDFWTGRPRAVLEIRAADLASYLPNLRRLARAHPDWTFYDCDIAPEIHYSYLNGLFPTARCEVEAAGGRLAACRVLDDPLDLAYEPMPLRVMHLSAEGRLAGARPRIHSITAETEGRGITWDSGDPREMFASLADHLRRADPDLILTEGGDPILMPALFTLAEQCGAALALDREAGIRRRLARDGRTYMSYGRILYQAPDYPLFGRWHIDRTNSFWIGEDAETSLAGLLEVARLAKIPVQRAARRSVGTGISSIQLDLACRDGYLIPWKKAQPEAWKPFSKLLLADRGGLVYQPLTGVYENAFELDFASMYPSIMASRNVSPETVNCACCPPSPDVPELEYALCRRRRGLVPRAIGPLIEKRMNYKRLMKSPATGPEARRLYEGRQGAIKWLLVCCFGYLGYRNARFGRIEAHESTCAFSRDLLMKAREICEARGFQVLHAIVDSVYIRREGEVQDAEIEALCEEIGRATNLRLAVEGRYRWLALLPSRQDPNIPVPNRFFGLFADGKLKCRGLELRRSDQAPFVREFQQGLLDSLAGAESLAACRARKNETLALVAEAAERIRQRRVPAEELTLQRKTSMRAEEYRSNGMTAVAARQAARAGISLHAGEAVHFLVLNAKDRDPDSRLRILQLLRPEDAYDAAFYIEQLRRAAATVLEPLMGEPLNAALPGSHPGPADVRPRAARPGRTPCEQLDLFAANGAG